MRALRPILLFLGLAATAGGALAQDMAIIPTRVIYPGETITADALQEVPLRRQNLGATIVAMSFGDVEGKVARRTLLPGRLIAVGSVRAAYLVDAGTPVTIVFRQGGLTISATAVPLQPGAAGDVIRVRNIDSGTTLTGVVMSDGTVMVGAT